MLVKKVHMILRFNRFIEQIENTFPPEETSALMLAIINLIVHQTFDGVLFEMENVKAAGTVAVFVASLQRSRKHDWKIPQQTIDS